VNLFEETGYSRLLQAMRSRTVRDGRPDRTDKDRISAADREAPEDADHQPSEDADLKTGVQADHNGPKDADLKTPEDELQAGGEQADATWGETYAALVGQGGVKPLVPDDAPEPDPGTLADEIADKEPYEAADELIVLPSNQAAHILMLMNPKTAAKALAALHDGAVHEVLKFLESGTLAKMLDELLPFDDDDAARILELAEVRRAAETLAQIVSWRGFALNKMEPETAAAVVDEMTLGELGKAGYFGGSPDPLDRLIGYVSTERVLFLMSKIDTERAAQLLGNTVLRNPERADEFLSEMKPGRAGRIFDEMNIDIAVKWITRMDAAASARLLETMKPQRAAKLLNRLEPDHAQELLNSMRPELAYHVTKSMEKPGED
jgi:flagellar motility protein MotE (MotC chaperone)